MITLLKVPTPHDDDYTARWVSPEELLGDDGLPFYNTRFGLLEILENGKEVADEWAADAERAQEMLDAFDFDTLTPKEERDPR